MKTDYFGRQCDSAIIFECNSRVTRVSCFWIFEVAIQIIIKAAAKRNQLHKNFSREHLAQKV